MTADDIVKIVHYFAYFIIAISNAAPTSKLPKDFIPCKVSGPDFDECVRDGVQRAMSHLSNDIPSFGIYKIDSFRISSMETNQSIGNILSIELNFNDLDVYNINDAQVIEAHYDPVNYIMYVKLIFPHYIMLEGNYEMAGNVLVLPIKGEGKCDINLDLSDGAIVHLQMKPKIKNQIIYLEVVNLNWDFIDTKISLNFGNLLNGDEVLGDDLNRFLNENWEVVLTELEPSLKDVFTHVYTKTVQQFLSHIPLNKILLD